MNETVLSKLDDQRLIRLLSDAIAHYSPPFAEQPAQAVFQEALDRAGLPHRLQAVPATAGDGRGNVVVHLGPEPAGLLWLGHIDTVPAITADHARPRRDGDILYGLGSADMKSGCAAAVEAAIALVESGVPLKKGLIIALVVGEEEYGDGATALLDRLHAPLCVVGEPTGLVPCVDHHGYLEMRLSCRGQRAHAALPEVGASAIHGMLAWLSAIVEEVASIDPAERPSTNPRQISGGGNLFIVADDCECTLDVHIPPGAADAAHAAIERARAQAEATHPNCRFGSEQVFWAPGYSLDAGDPRLEPLTTAFERTGRTFEPAPFRSHSDAGLFYSKGSLPVVCGPGRLEVAHTRHEHVHLSEVTAAARLYAELFYAACCT